MTQPNVIVFSSASVDKVPMLADNNVFTGTNTFSGSTVLNGALSGTSVKDEDTMASDSATAVPTQQSTKAYVDTHASDTSTHGVTTVAGLAEDQQFTGTNTFSGAVILNDNVSVLLGTGSDGELFHDGTNTYFQNNTGNIIIENDASDGDISFKVNDGGVDTTVMTLDGATGNVGIGTTTPGSGISLDTKLHIYGSGTGTTGRTNLTVQNVTANSAARIDVVNSDGNSFSLQASGPSYVTGDQALFSTVNLNMRFQTDGNLSSGGTHSINFAAGGYSVDSQMTILPSGNVGIGTTSPVSNLDVASSTGGILTIGNSAAAFSNSTTIGTLQFYAKDNQTTTNFIVADIIGQSVTSGSILTDINPGELIFRTTGSAVAATPAERMRITTSGNVGIGTTSPAGRLHINGTADDQQLIVEAHSSQTANIVEIRNSSSNVLAHISPTGGALFKDKIAFTQTDGNEYIDSLADGYLDYRATTAHRFGDGTNQTIIKDDGEINLEGTARVYKVIALRPSGFGVPGTKPAISVDHGIGLAWEFSDATDDTIGAEMQLPQDMDRSVAPEFNIGWDSDTADPGDDSKQCVWQLEYLYLSLNEDVTAAAQETLTVTTSASTTANGLVVSTITGLDLPSATDRFMLIRLKRLGADGDDDLGDVAYLNGCGFKYTSNKLGVAT